ncbi:thioesterase family protein [Blastomonas aquatica]|uniref:Acyl-CoA thioesterase n=1 Tax=Blastomonas aquatica TaxID=1510276 RepID=A0ABQ1JGD8_9SPHN|nr:acyl-CoA thioesterase [Blastomonas aquatica]
MNLAETLASLVPADNGWTVTIPSDWMQGRTAYGGLSSALAHHCARLAVPDAPPLRSAQVAFVGPLANEVTISCDLQRRGRNTAFVETKIRNADGLGFIGTFIFMSKRESKIDFEGVHRPDVAPPPAEGSTRSGPPEFFTSQMEYPEKRLELGMNTPRLASWHRFAERDGLDAMTELLCIGDGLPPSAMGLMDAAGPISSMNWQVNMLTDAPETENGWWLLESVTHHAHHGASSQYMTVWNSRLEPVMAAMQSVALFV